MEVKVTKRLYSAQKSLRRVSANLLGNWRRQLAARRKVIIVLNPAAGGDHPILKTMNSVFQPFDLNWDIDLTHRYGDGWRLAQRAIAKGANVVGIYGGDGTVVEVASGLMGNRVPLGILPGVTCLILQVDNLGIPTLSATLPGPRHGLLDSTPIEVHMLPRPVRVLVPAAAAPQQG